MALLAARGPEHPPPSQSERDRIRELSKYVIDVHLILERLSVRVSLTGPLGTIAPSHIMIHTARMRRWVTSSPVPRPFPPTLP
jgi:hypothetical protein